MSYGWEGKLIRLVPLDLERHFENACRWVNDPEVTENLLIGHYPTTKIAERQWFERRSEQGGTEVSFAIESLDGSHLGFSGLHDVNFRHGTAVSGTLIGAREEWGKGFGTDAARVRTYYAFEILGLRMLMSAFFEGNERSMRMQARVGYQQCGRIPKKVWNHGKYVDEIVTYIDRDMWLAKNALAT